MMDWDRCIDVNRRDLLPLVAQMLAMLGDGQTVMRHVHLAILALLRPAESALRRLIAIAAKDIVITPRKRRSPPADRIPKGEGKRERPPSFLLIDPRRQAGPPKRKNVPGFGPNIRGLDGLDPSPPGEVATPADDPVSAVADDPVSAVAIRRRIEALIHAMGDVPAQARRLARKLATMERPIRAMRPGRPPGFVAGGKRAIDRLLADCHELALMALAEVPP